MPTVWDKISRWCLYLVFLLTPLFFLPWTVFPLAFNKQTLLVALVLLAAISWLAGGIAKGELVYAKSFLNPIIVGLVIFSAVSAWLSGAKIPGLFGINGGETDVFINILSFSLFLFLAAAIFRNSQERQFIIILFLVGALAVIVYSFLQILNWWLLPWEFTRSAAFNPIGTTNALSIYVGLVFVLALSLFYLGGRENFFAKNKFWRVALLILAAVSFLMAFLIGYWPVFAGWAAAVLVLTIAVLKLKGISDSKNHLPLFTLLVVLVLLLLSQFNVLVFRLPSFNLPPEVSPNLSASWGVVKRTSEENIKNFIFGSGPATYQYKYALYRGGDLNVTPFWSTRFSHGINSFTTHLVNWGTAGTLLWLIFLIVLLVESWRGAIASVKKRWSVTWVIFIALLYLTVLLFFYPPNFTLYFTIFALGSLAIGIRSDSGSRYTAFSLAGNQQKTFFLLVTAMVIVVISAALLYFQGQRYLAALYFDRGVKTMARTNDIEQALPYFIKASRLDARNDFYLRSLAGARVAGIDQLLEKRSSISRKELEAALSDNLQRAVEAAQSATKVNRLNSQNWLSLAQVYENFINLVSGSAALAFTAYEKAVQLEPTNPAVYAGWGRAYFVAGDYPKAIAQLEKAISLKFDYAPAHFLLVQVADRRGQVEEAIAKADRIKNLDPDNAGLLFQIGLLHYRAGRLDQARKELDSAVKLQPDYSNARYFLGLVYSRQGAKEKAIEQLTAVSRLNPDNQEVKLMIENIRSGKPALAGVDQKRLPEAPLPE